MDRIENVEEIPTETVDNQGPTESAIVAMVDGKPMRAEARLLFLAPEDIAITEATNVRPWSIKAGESEDELKALESLGQSIAEEGQIQPVFVMEMKGDADAGDGAEPMYELVAGRRRHKAVIMYNLTAPEDKQIKLKAMVVDTAYGTEDKRAGHAYRQAAHENILRQNISAMDFALNIQHVRQKFGYKGAKGTAKVAEFFKVSPATVTQHEKLLALAEDVQQKVHEGVLTREAAFALTAVPVEKQQEVLDNAVIRQREEKAKADDAAAEQAVGKRRGAVPGAAPSPEGTGSGAAAEAGKSKGARKKSAKSTAEPQSVKARHVKSAARDAGVVAGQSRSKKEIVEFFEGMQGPAYGHADGAVRVFVDKFTAWVKGELTDKTLMKYWDAMVVGASKGTEPVAVEAKGKEAKKDAKKKK